MFTFAFHCVKRLKCRVGTPFIRREKMPVATLLEPAVGFKGRRNFMAMYHFRLKSDKKPNGTKISAVKHVEYINREGLFLTTVTNSKPINSSRISSRRKKPQMRSEHCWKKSCLNQIKLALQNKQTELETLCHQPEVAKKIEEIATGILRKNYKLVRQL